MEFRTLKANEIDVKVGTVGKKGYTLLLYKNARTDMQILDETVGPENWQRDHKECKGNLYCGIGIWCKEKSQWVWKWDCGVESDCGDKEKGEASDSFKRAGFNIGIGRELYTAPFIFIQCETESTDGKHYKIKNLDDVKRSNLMKVSEIEYDKQRQIKRLVIKDFQDYTAFVYGEKQKNIKPIENTENLRSFGAVGGDYKLTSGSYSGKTIAEIEELDKNYLDKLLESDKVSQVVKDNINTFRSK